MVGQLQVRLLGATPTVRETDPRAYALYLQGRELSRRLTPEALTRSDSLLRQVLAIDPRYAPAWTRLAANFAHEANIGVVSNEEGYRRAREAAGKALAIDPGYAPAHGELGYIARSAGDLAGAARELERALALDATDPDVLGNSAVLLASLGRLKEAIALQEYVVARDPVNLSRLSNLGYTYVRDGRYDDAIARLRTGLSLSPGFGAAHFLIGEALLLKGNAPAALGEMQRETSESWRLGGLAMADHALGREAQSDSALAALVRKYPKDAPYNIAYVHAFRGQPDQAFAWLDRAVEYGDPGLAEIPAEPLFERIHSDPRWLPFLRRIGKAPEQLARIHFQVDLPQSGDTATAAARSAPPPVAAASE